MAFILDDCNIFTQVAELCILFGVLNFYIYNLIIQIFCFTNDAKCFCAEPSFECMYGLLCSGFRYLPN